MSEPAGRKFIGEPLATVSAIDAGVMVSGQPSAPESFVWREEGYQVRHVLSAWKEVSGGGKGGEPGYVRKHWFRLHLTNGWVAEVYFLRQPQGKGKPRWYLYTLTRPTGDGATQPP